MDRAASIKIADVSTRIRKFELQDGAIFARAFPPDGSRIAVAGAADDVPIYQTQTGERTATCKGHKRTYAVAFSPDGGPLATGGFDGQVRICEVPSGKPVRAFGSLPGGTQMEATIGTYPLRVQTQDGISNILLSTVGALPEVTEGESKPESPEHANDSTETAERIEAPVIVNGTLRGPDRDYYRVHAKQGERLVFEVEARRLGSAIDPVLRIVDAEGKQLARSDDAPALGVD